MNPDTANDRAALWLALSDHLTSAQEALLCAASEHFLAQLEAARRVAVAIASNLEQPGSQPEQASLRGPVLLVRHQALVLAALLKRHKRYSNSMESLATTDSTYRPRGS